jgi:UDP-N-acetylglucosamine 2-epimerase (non-hydrolysing)
MIDSLVALEPVVRAHPHPLPGLAARPYAVATFHRPSNVDEPKALQGIVDGLTTLARRIDVVFPVHPRTRQRLSASGLLGKLEQAGAIHVTEPLGYTDFMRCLFGATMVVTDSGGVQEETTYLGIPCFTARSSTERPITVSNGTNRLISVSDIGTLPVGGVQHERPQLPFWDGQTAARIASVFERYFSDGAPLRPH